MVRDTITFSLDKDLKIELKVIAVRKETTLTKKIMVHELSLPLTWHF